MDYLYEAVDASGRTVMGKIDAMDEGEVRRKLSQMGYRPQTVALGRPAVQTNAVVPRQAGTGSVAVASPPAHSSMQTGASAARSGGITLAGNAAKVGARAATQTQNRTGTIAGSNLLPTTVDPNASKLGGVSTKELAFYFQQLGSLVKSGMTIFAALDNLAPRTPNKNLAQTAREMAEAARKGQRVSEVMAHYPRIYPDHIVGMVRAGETGGFLEIALAEIALNFEQNLALYKGMWFPKLLASQALYFLPILIPLMPCLLSSLDVGANMRLYLKWELILLPLTAALHLLFLRAVKHSQLPQYRRLRDTVSLKLPAFGDLQRTVALSAFVRMLRRLHQAGVPPIDAWECAMNTADNIVIRERLAASYQQMNKGASFADAFAGTGLFDSQIENLVITGQHSGEIVESLDKAADFYQDAVYTATTRARRTMLSIGVTTMLVLVGGAGLWFVHSYFHGMFDFVDKNFSTDYLPLF